jgi:hypothetical protein
MMQKTLAGACKILGVLAVIAAGLWSLFASSFSAFGGGEAPRILAFLLMAPLALLPAGVLATSRPRWAGGGLIVGAFASGAWLLFVLHDYQGGPLSYWEAQIPLMVTCLPMALLGGGLLLAPSGTASRPTSRLGTRWASAHVLATLLVLLWVGVAARNVAVKNRWTLTVTPAGGTARAVQLDARSHQVELDRLISAALEPLLKDPGGARPLSLGRYELAGFGAGGREIRLAHECRLEAEREHVTIRRSDQPKEQVFIDADSFWNAKLVAVQALDSFVTLHRFWPR